MNPEREYQVLSLIEEKLKRDLDPDVVEAVKIVGSQYEKCLAGTATIEMAEDVYIALSEKYFHNRQDALQFGDREKAQLCSDKSLGIHEVHLMYEKILKETKA